MSMLENLRVIREEGIEAFVDSERRRWACPECSGLGCAHTAECIYWVFFTTDKFTGPAIDFAKSIKKRIVLIDGPELARLMVQHRVGVTVTKTLPLARLDSDYFDPDMEA